LTITDQGEDEIGRLLTFLGAVRDGLPHEDGNYLMVRIGDNLTRSDVQRMMSALSSGERASLMAQALASVDGEPATLKAISEVAVSNPAASRAAAAVINLTQMSAALKDLRRLVDANASEHELQRHLTRHPWLFGSEYSERLPDRKWTRDEQQDFMLRRTIDGYIELIEIKTTLSGADLFRLDRSHSTYVPCAQLTAAQSQVENYLERIDADRYAIQARDREDPNKIRAKLIIGRDGNDAQQAALRRHNGHIHRIEIITFDQLIRVGERVIQNLQGVVSPLSKKPETTRPRMCSPVPGQPPLSPSAFDDVPF
jgi:hypothetical protein